MSLPSAVIFDWDNTLVDSWPAIAEAINYVRTKYGQPVWTYDEIIERCIRSARDSFPEWFGDKWQTAFDDYYAMFEKTRARIGTKPLNGAADLLAWLKQNKIPALVVSNKKGAYLREESTMLGWDGYFVSMAGAGDAVRDKPDRAHADHALNLAGIESAESIWFVGDSEADIACARNTGCTPVMVGNRTLADKLSVKIYAKDCAALLSLLSQAQQ